MVYMNENYLSLQQNYLFSTIQKKVATYQSENPHTSLIKLGIGDVTLPLPASVIHALHQATDDMAVGNTFKGYGPEQGYDFLKESILEYDYQKRGIELEKDEIFISDGAKCDAGNLTELFTKHTSIGIIDPVYPVYLDSNVMCGRAGHFKENTNQYENIHYIPVTAENHFIPTIPEEPIDIIYLCYPNNPTGTVLTKEQLKEWVDYAYHFNSLIIFDSAYEAFITDPEIPHSIYEIENAKHVAIELRSFSKTAGMTGIRCAYTIIPKELQVFTKDKTPYSLNALWKRRQCTKFNGASYLSQRAAQAIYSPEGRLEVAQNIAYYLSNATAIYEALQQSGFQVYGGKNSPYVWIKTPNHMKSWNFFDYLLDNANVVGTPGIGFGNAGEGYFRLTGFGKKSDTDEAIKRITDCFS